MLRATKHFNRRLFLSVLLICISQFNYGFDNGGFNTTQAMDAFTKQFGEFDPKTKTWFLPTYWISLFNSLSFLGQAAGLVIGSLVSQRWGRRMAMFSMCFYAFVSATVVITAQTREQIMVGRIFNYIYVGMEVATVPIFQGEIVPGPVRGLVVSTYQLCIVIGGFVMNGVARGTGSLPDRRAYMIPYGLFYIVPAIVSSLIWFIPESPRWLMTKGRIDEARAAHYKYREGTMSAEAIETEFSQLHESLLNEPEQGRTKELFQGTNVKRTLIIVGLFFFQQATGQAFVSQYGALFIKSLGTVNPFSITLSSSAIGIATILFLTMVLVDKTGRRPLLFASSGIQGAALITMGALGLQQPVSFEHKAGIVAMFLIDGLGYLLAWGPLSWVIATELSALRLRDRTQRLTALVGIFMNFLVNFIIPYLMNAPYANLGSRVGFIFGGMTALAAIFTYFCVPECKGRSLEEIDRMFQEKIPIRKFRTYPRINIEIDAAAAAARIGSVSSAEEGQRKPEFAVQDDGKA